MTSIRTTRSIWLLVATVAAVVAMLGGLVISASAQTAYVAEGHIDGANPSPLGGVTENEFGFQTCPEMPESQGVDGYVFELPDDFDVAGKDATATGDSAAPQYNLDFAWYEADCTFIDATVSGDADEIAPVPAGTHFIVVNQAVGADTAVCLVVGNGVCPSGSASPSGSSTARPSGSSTARPSGSASPSGSPGGDDITTSIATDRTKVKFRAQFTLSGEVTADDSCERPFVVSIGQRVHGTDTFKTIEQGIPVAQNNTWSRKVSSKFSADYRATVRDDGACGGGSSGAVAVRVKAKVGVKVPATCSAPQSVGGRVSPNHRGSKVQLQAREGNKWRTKDSAQLNRRSRYRLVAPSCDGAYRVVWPAADERNLRGIKRFHF